MLEGADSAAKLVQARKLYESTLDYYEANRWFDEADADERYRHGHQWSEEDISYLRKQLRPALTFNLIAPKVLHMVGAIEDNMQQPVVTGRGDRGRFLADLLNTLDDRLCEETNADEVDAEVFDRGATTGLGSAAIDAMPHPEDLSRVKVTFDALRPYEVLWDPSAERRDRSDGRFLFWHKWLSRSEFKIEYPEKADRIEQIFRDRDLTPSPAVWAAPSVSERRPTGYQAKRELLYYNRHKDQVRVIRLEYRRPERARFAFDPATKQSREVTPDVERAMRAVDPSMEFTSVWRESWGWFEFIGDEVLYDDETPLPIDGFSVSSFVCHADHRNLPYGMVRFLRDPQSEVNKRFSQMLHMLVQQGGPGVYAEPKAFVDDRQAERAMKMAGAIVHLQANGLQRIKERPAPAFPDAPAQIHQHAIRLIDMISGVWQDELMEPRGIPEAAATAHLKHRQSLLSMRPIMRGFTAYQRQTFGKRLQLIVRVLPDEQISEMLGDSERYAVRGRVVVDLKAQRQAPIEAVRGVRHSIEVKPAEENNVERLLNLNMLMQISTLGMPVDPEVLIEQLPLSTDDRQRLVDYVRSSMMSQAKSAQAQIQSSQRELARQAAMEAADRRLSAAELAEKARHNQALEVIQASKVQKDLTQLLSDRSLEEQTLVLDTVKAILAAGAKRAGTPGEGAPAAAPEV